VKGVCVCVCVYRSKRVLLAAAVGHGRLEGKKRGGERAKVNEESKRRDGQNQTKPLWQAQTRPFIERPFEHPRYLSPTHTQPHPSLPAPPGPNTPTHIPRSPRYPPPPRKKNKHTHTKPKSNHHCSPTSTPRIFFPRFVALGMKRAGLKASRGMEGCSPATSWAITRPVAGCVCVGVCVCVFVVVCVCVCVRVCVYVCVSVCVGCLLGGRADE
jgi:hypothetical protein